MTEQTVRLSIDGRDIHCPATWTVYEAATAAGIHIPTFCHHPKLVPVSACRTCLVEVEGMRGLQTSCSLPVRDGMVVRVHTSPVAVKTRTAVLEFLLTNHPLDCPVCDKGGECPLQNQTMADGPGMSRYGERKRHKSKRLPLSDLIVIDQERCVLCWRCIRFLDEWAGDHELELFGRGAATRLDVAPGRSLTSKWQGNTIDICPVGALTSREFRFEARVWELANTPSVCPLCSVGCNVVLGVKNNDLRRVVARENAQVNDAWLCDRGRFALGFVDHPDRLRTPLIRREGSLRPATWDEALGLIAQRLRAVAQERGPQSIGGLGSTRVTNEASYLFQRLLRSVVGTNNVDHLGRLPAGVSLLSSLPELERKDGILLLGFDPSTEAPLVELWIKKAVLRHGAGVVCAHPRQIELCRYGGQWLGYRPGGETLLAQGLTAALLGLRPEGGAARASNVDEARSWLEGYGPARVQLGTGVAASALMQAARLLAQAARPLILVGPAWLSGGVPGTRPSEAGSPPAAPALRTAPALPVNRRAGERAHRVQPALEALANLALALGCAEVAFVPEDNNTIGALEMGVVPDLLPGQQPLGETKLRSRLAGVWGGRLSPLDGLDFAGMMAAAESQDLLALWVMGSDPVSDRRVAGQALGRIPFLVVQDLFMTETASLAEVVLPAASFAETGGTFFNLTGRLQAMRPALRPPGQAQPDWWIIAQLARRMVDSRRQKAWDLSGPEAVLEEIAKVLPGWRGAGSAGLEQQGYQPPRSAAAPRRSFARVVPEVSLPSPEYPLCLATGRLLYDRGTLQSRSPRIQGLVPGPHVLVHPGDAQRLALQDDDEVSVISPAGRLEFRLRVSEGIAPGVAFIPLNLTATPVSALLADDGTLLPVRIAR